MFKMYAMKGTVYTAISIASLFSVSGPVEQFKNYIGYKYTEAKFRIINKLALSNGYTPYVPEKTWNDLAEQYALSERINPCLVKAVIQVESKNCTQLISHAGALGCMQLMPKTAAAYGLHTTADILDPEQNIYVGTKHLAEVVKRYGLIHGLKVYNAGPTKVDKSEENRNYAPKVLAALATCVG